MADAAPEAGSALAVLAPVLSHPHAGAFWTAFLRSLRARGLSGAQLVTSEAHTGLKAAIESILLGAGWQWCKQHFARPGEHDKDGDRGSEDLDQGERDAPGVGVARRGQRERRWPLR